MTTEPHTTSRRPRRRYAALALVAAVAASGAVTTTGSGTATSDDSRVSLEMSPSMVEMLDEDDTGTPMTLPEVRKFAQAFVGSDAYDGTGVDVAVIDTGVAPVPGLDGSDKVLHGPDLSFEGESPDAAYLDTYGHGTHMAAIIAGERTNHEGIAPGARIVSIKTAGHDGVTTVPQVVAAIDWVIEHRNVDGLDIRVLNLSLGQAGVHSHVGDHLSAAVERAWEHGILVVVAAGNRGETQKHLDSPAIDPYVLAIGAHDPYLDTSTDDELAKTTTTDSQTLLVSGSLATSPRLGHAESRVSGGVPSWSAQGNGARNPDAIVAGRSIASYRVPGSTIDTLAPGARYGDGLFLGSGTSQSAAVTSGMAALMLQAHPALTPDQLKAALTRTAGDLPVSADRDGNGVLNGYQAATAMDIGDADQKHPVAHGSGTGVVLPTGATWSGGTWSSGQWSGATWSGATWSGGQWSGATWSGATWSGASWSGATWSGATWSGASWSGASWSGATWSGATWSGEGWS